MRAFVLLTVSACRLHFDPLADAADTANSCWPAWHAGTVTFGTPRLMTELPFIDAQGDPSITSDDLHLYFRRMMPTDNDLMMATRAHAGDLWDPPVPASDLNSLRNETRITLTGDGLIAILASDRGGSVGLYDLWLASRAQPGDLFDTASEAQLAAVETPTAELDPELVPDGLTLYFSSSATGQQQIMRTTRTSTSTAFDPPVFVTELMISGSLNADPTISPDDRVIVFTSKIIAGGDLTLYYATRSTTATPFDTPVIVPMLHIPGFNDHDAELGPDGCELFFASSRNGGIGDLFVATVGG